MLTLAEYFKRFAKAKRRGRAARHTEGITNYISLDEPFRADLTVWRVELCRRPTESFVGDRGEDKAFISGISLVIFYAANGAV